MVIGYDDTCQASEEWIAQMGVDRLPAGRAQPFFHVLVDERDRPGSQTTYVAQENIVRADRRRIASEPLRHAMIGQLLWTDRFDQGKGVYEPKAELRALYPRGTHGCWLVDGVTPEQPLEEED